MSKSKFYNEYQKARDAAWKVLLDCDVKMLPVHVKMVCKKLGVLVYSYKSGHSLINEYGLLRYTVNDGFSTVIKGKYVIFYNDRCPLSRLRFTVMHELGHILLGHLDGQNAVFRANATDWNLDDEEPSIKETAANIFASRVLAPACILWALNIHGKDEIKKLCGLSSSAAYLRAQRMETLYARERRWATSGKTCFLKSENEKKLFSQFHDFIIAYNDKINNTKG